MSPLKFALIGRDISHSLSPEIYQRLIARPHTYDLIDCASADAVPRVTELARTYTGVNITAPWKEIFFPYADPSSRVWGAVNCIRFQDGTAIATNTDALALQELIPQVWAKYKGHDFVILGDGVMSKVFMKILDSLGLPGVVQSRKKGDDISRAIFPNDNKDSRTIVVNACSRSFEFHGQLGAGCVFWDLNYRHLVHSKYASREGWAYIDGYQLLETQAKYAVKFWMLEKSN